jgi:hypothetical protein
VDATDIGTGARSCTNWLPVPCGSRLTLMARPRLAANLDEQDPAGVRRHDQPSDELAEKPVQAAAGSYEQGDPCDEQEEAQRDRRR